MFIDFFFALRQHNIKVTTIEWLTLMEAVKRGLAGESLMGFYTLCRGICVKSEVYYDDYDQCFASYFHGVEAPQKMKDEILEWLESAKIPEEFRNLKGQLKEWDFNKLREEFEKRMREQKERHDGGSHYIGTGGTSPFGHSGYHPGGIRVGGTTGQRSASQVASSREFKELRKDRILDTRSIGMALKRLRTLGRLGEASEIDIDSTIQATARNLGDLSLQFQAPRKNTLKIVLMMDIGGSMTAYTRICEQLFSAAHAANHFQSFRYYYFHNCPYETLYAGDPKSWTQTALKTEALLKELDSSWNLIMVGDAAMHPYELIASGGAIDYFHYNEKPGIEWLKLIKTHLPKSIWLNPEPQSSWNIPSNRIIRQVFPSMYPLNLAGLSEAISHLNALQKISA